MRSFLVIVIVGAWLNTGHAQFTPPETTTARSFSGQFLVRALDVPAGTALAPAATNQHLIRLEATLVAVSCERIKQLASNDTEIILPPPRPGANGLRLTSANVSARRDTPQEQARKKLHSRAPLSFDELSWPAEEHWSGDAGEAYRGSAQLFLNELI